MSFAIFHADTAKHAQLQDDQQPPHRPATAEMVPTCSWQGVVCNTATLRVTGITLAPPYTYSPQISAPLDGWPELLSLQSIQMQRNQLRGTLPAAWASLPMLSYVDVSANTLGGTLPSSWGIHGVGMKHVNLSNNNFQVNMVMPSILRHFKFAT